MENQLNSWTEWSLENLLKITSISGSEIYLKSAHFLGQKSIENQLVFWGRTILKIRPFCGANVQLKSAFFSMDFYPRIRINFQYFPFSWKESHQLYSANFKFSFFSAEFCWFSRQQNELKNPLIFQPRKWAEISWFSSQENG